MTLYSVLFYLFSPVIFLAFVWRYGLRRTLRGLPERLGFGGPRSTSKGTLWIHAASVGEVRAVEPFLRRLPERVSGPRLLTTTTVNAATLAQSLGVADRVRLAPVDRPGALRRFLERETPRALILVETELWPHWLAGLSRRGIPVGVVNGRISDGAFPLYYRLRSFWEPLLATMVRVGVQNPTHASRFLQLGCHPESVVITGNLKFDVPLPDPARRGALRPLYRLPEDTPVWAAGSTHPGEEGVVLQAFQNLRATTPRLRLLSAPRHVERAAEVRRLFTAAGFTVVLRSELSQFAGDWDVLVMDTVGELADAYGLATAAFVGGSLVPRGGQNPLEPARWGVPVLHGPHMENFRDMQKTFREGEAAREVRNAGDISLAVGEILSSAEKARAWGDRARSVAEGQRGALDASLTLVEETVRTVPRVYKGRCSSC